MKIVTIEDIALSAVGTWLKTQGWNPVVISFKQIEHDPADLPHNFRLVVNFTGSKNPMIETRRDTNDENTTV